MREVAQTLFSGVLSKSPPGPVKALIPYVICHAVWYVVPEYTS